MENVRDIRLFTVWWEMKAKGCVRKKPDRVLQPMTASGLEEERWRLAFPQHLFEVHNNILEHL